MKHLREHGFDVGAIDTMHTRATWERVRRDVLAVSVLVAASVVNALPPLLNAAGTQSDAAIVGLQAMHSMRGEIAWSLWGSSYQTSVDSWVASVFFRLLGATPLALMLSTFTGYLALTGFAYATLRRHVSAGIAALLVLPIVIMAGPVHIYAFYPPRQASLTLLFAAIWALDGAASGRRATFRLAAGGFVAGLAVLADPYCLVFTPAIVLFIVITARQGCERWVRGAVAGVTGLVGGLSPFVAIVSGRGATPGVYRLTEGVFSHNVKLLARECLPYLLSTKVAMFSPSGGDGWFHPPAWFHAVELVGAGSLLAGIALGGVAAFSELVPASERRLGALGAVILPITLAAFCFSVMAMDRLSARYLVSIVLLSPFALAPLVRLAGTARFAAMLAPYLVSVAVGGWLGNGNNVDGVRIRRDNGLAKDEHALAELLRARGIRYGLADYWVAYRLTFLFREDPILVPWHAALDRYPPYRRATEAEAVVAYVYDPYWSREELASRERDFRSAGSGFEPDFDETRVGRYTVLVLTRTGTAENVARRVRSQQNPVAVVHLRP